MSDDPVVLYLLMRTDMASMNPGKACAQAHHAATMLAACADKDSALFQEWLLQGWYFGTVLTFGCDEDTITRITRAACMFGHVHGIVFDPTYPVRDGQVTHLIPLMTCGYVLCRKSQADFMGSLQLMY